jgi:hypothetical protein
MPTAGIAIYFSRCLDELTEAGYRCREGILSLFWGGTAPGTVAWSKSPGLLKDTREVYLGLVKKVRLQFEE